MKIDPDFFELISYLDLELLSESEDIIYILDAHLALRAYNNAWINFAKNNNGQDLTQSYTFGSEIIHAATEPLKSYIKKSYHNAINDNAPFFQRYECSSPHKYRVFLETAYPLIESRGLVISHNLVIERNHTIEEVEFTERFVNEHGIITQCSNCRKIRNPDNNQSWLWVPVLVEKTLSNISHGLCPPCIDYYYPNID